MAQPLTPRLEALTQLPCTRLIHHVSKNEIVQIHIEFKRKEDYEFQDRLLKNPALQRRLFEFIFHVVDGRLALEETVWLDELIVTAFARPWTLPDEFIFAQNGVEILGHPRKYAFILRFISPELIQSLKDYYGVK